MKLDESNFNYNNVVVMDRYGGIEIGAAATSSSSTQRPKKSSIFFEPRAKSTKKPKVSPMVNQQFSFFSNYL